MPMVEVRLSRWNSNLSMNSEGIENVKDLIKLILTVSIGFPCGECGDGTWCLQGFSL